jgi:hypothetical protein
MGTAEDASIASNARGCAALSSARDEFRLAAIEQNLKTVALGYSGRHSNAPPFELPGAPTSALPSQAVLGHTPLTKTPFIDGIDPNRTECVTVDVQGAEALLP